jgi:bifunctional DNase/RNase
VERVIINDLKSETYFARLILSAENELFEKKIIELDGRPSDCIALAIQQKAPLYVSREVWDEVEDRSDVLKQIEESEKEGGESPEAEE